MRRLVGMRQIGGALVLTVAMSLAGVAAVQAEKKAAQEEAVPSWVNWLNAGLPFDFQLTGLDVEGGYRFIGGDRSSAKFQEYRVLQESPFLDHGWLYLETKNKKRYIEFSTFDPFKNDQSYDLRAGKYGEYDLEIFWDQIPHVLSTTGRTVFATTITDSTALLTLPPDAPRTSPSAAVLTNFLNQRAIPVDLEFTTSKGGAAFKYALTDSLDFGVRYTFTEKDGTIPFGAGFGSPGGTIVELPAPLFNRTHLGEAKAQFARPGWNVGLGYAASFFDQGIDSVTFDNPIQATNTATASARGRSTFDPSNQAHNVFLTGGLSLPLRTRITGKVSYGWRFQDEPFVAHTINPVIGANPLLALPQSSLDGDVRTTLVTLNATSRPLPMVPLTLSGGYRYYDFDNNTHEIEFLAHVVRDQGAAVTDIRVNAPYSYSKHNARLDAGYRLLSNLNFRLGYEWERWDRNSDHREVPTSDENTLKTSFDFTPNDWLLLRGAYRRGWRSISNYNTQAHLAHVVQDFEGDVFTLEAQGQSILLRKFDEADRTRDRVELLASITPLESLNFTVTYSLLHDDFDKSRPPQPTSSDPPGTPPHDTSPLGLNESTGWSLGGDLAYTPFSWLSLFVNYMREEFRYDQLSRSRAVAGGVTLDFIDFNWRSVNTDLIDTYGVGADVSLIPDRLNFKLTWSFSEADTIIRSFNPVTPTSGTAAQDLTATAFNFPTDNTSLHTLIAALRYKLTKNLSIKGEYRWEQFRETNWQTDTINLTGLGGTTAPIGTDVFLGAKFLQDYDAHIGALTLRYSF